MQCVVNPQSTGIGRDCFVLYAPGGHGRPLAFNGSGHTLADAKNPATLEPMVFPDPVISIAVSPKDKAGNENMGVAIGKMVVEDPSFRVMTDEESGETILMGMGELHLDIK